MVVEETIEGLKGYGCYAARDSTPLIYSGDPPSITENGTLLGYGVCSDNHLSSLLCETIPKNTYRRIKSINFDTGVVEYEIGDTEKAYIMEKHVRTWCQSMRGRAAPTEAEEDLWNACRKLGLLTYE